MKKYLLLLAFTGFGIFATAQNQEDFTNLRLPANPGFTILGIEPTSVEEPNTPTDFLLSAANATKEFSALPRDYAVTFSPYTVFSKKDSLPTTGFGKTLWRTMSISLATHTADTVGTQFGFGTKVTLFRKNMAKVFLQKVTDAQLADPLVQKYRDAMDLAAADARMNEITDSVANLTAGQVTSVDGGFLDLGTAMAYNLPKQAFDSTAFVSRYGIWLTGGYVYNPAGDNEEQGTRFNFIGVARLFLDFKSQYLNANDELVSGTVKTWDIGGKLGFVQRLGKKAGVISFGVEALARNTFEDLKNKTTWKLAGSIDYQFFDNKVITFTFGKDFDQQKITTGGNLLAALNLFMGFGSGRSINMAGQ